MRTPNSKCLVCGKAKYRRPYELKKTKNVCCKSCRGQLYHLKPSIWSTNLSRGYGWNRGMAKANGDRLVYGKPRSSLTKHLISEANKGKILSRAHRDKLRKNMVERRSEQPKEGTDIECLLEGWLVDNGLMFEKHKPVEGISNPDFFLEPRTCLYADGDYWHGLPNVKRRDERISKVLQAKGYRVIRLLGSEIKGGVRPNELLQAS